MPDWTRLPDDTQSITKENNRELPTQVPPITAVLHEAVQHEDTLVGRVYDHSRFPDGMVITTSPIVHEFRLVQTMSGSFYLVEVPRAQGQQPVEEGSEPDSDERWANWDREGRPAGGEAYPVGPRAIDW